MNNLTCNAGQTSSAVLLKETLLSPEPPKMSTCNSCALRKAARFDPLTNVLNRRAFVAVLQTVWFSASAADHQVILVDLDRFKEINDRYGHLAGDAVLIEAARRLVEGAPKAVSVARLGGDEFALLLTADGETGESIASELVASLANSIVLPCGAHVTVGASAGVASVQRTAKEQTASVLLANADLALYAAKAAGGGRAVRYVEGLRRDLDQRAQTSRKLEAALAQKQLEVAYQPIFTLHREVVCVEALVRWPEADGQFVPPSTFVPIAEEFGLIGPLGEFVLNTACRASAAWSDTKIALNVSPQQLQKAAFSDEFLRSIRCAGQTPERIIIEVTESVLIENEKLAKYHLTKLREAGVEIALDDFGVGYSSLRYLQAFQFDKLKIDRSFVTGITRDSTMHKVIAGIVGLASALGAKVVAEGVETSEQFDLLAASGVEQFQGFHLSRPLPARAVGDLLRADVARRCRGALAEETECGTLSVCSG